MRRDLARALAAGFLGGEWSKRGLVDSGALVLGRRRRWLSSLSGQVLVYYPRPPLDRPRELSEVIALCPAAQKAGTARPVLHPVTPTRMVTNPWQLVELHGVDDVRAFLRLSPGELAWFSDPRHWSRTAQQRPLQHYRVSTRTAPSGAVRVLEAPKSELRMLQRRLLDRVIGRIPPHEAAHGFRVGRSVATYVAPHVGQAVVVRLDLEGFFASVTVGRVYGVLRAAGYPEPVAHCLAGLMTTVLPLQAWQNVPRPRDPALLEAHWRLGRRLAAPHLPQGAPTSPALANLTAHRLDVRLAALAHAWGAHYTRYADDIAISSARDWRAGTTQLIDVIAQIAHAEGFRLNTRKTSVLRPHQRQKLGGLVVNRSPRVPRAEVDRLRAVLHNCIQHGPSTQNRHGHSDIEAHPRGRIAWVAQHDPVRGARLRAQLDAIDWNR
ncbi:MAG TPA: reverse transcriptase family protein [Nocardioidaceae bacterium]|nr:reverse transcriptase family protein [Nocardioidaceae bacterium]